MGRVELILTTNPGIEDIVAEEAAAKLGAELIEAREGHGRVVVSVDEDNIYLVDELRSIHRARLLLAKGGVCAARSCLDEVYRLVLESGVEDYLTPDSSFAVRVTRAGSHEYTSLDIARVAGDAVIEAARRRRGFRPRVDLDYPSLIVAVDVVNEEATVSIELGGDLSWHRRGYRIYDHPAALKPTLAYAMIILSGAVDGDHIMDPMCGGGTVAVEAALIFESSPVTCMDKNPRHIHGARMNAAAALVGNRIRFLVGDATRLSSYVESVDVVVSNPPYGIRMGSPSKVRRVYEGFVDEAARVVRKRIVVITPEYNYFRRLLEARGWKIVHERRVAHGNLYPHIIVAEPG